MAASKREPRSAVRRRAERGVIATYLLELSRRRRERRPGAARRRAAVAADSA